MNEFHHDAFDFDETGASEAGNMEGGSAASGDIKKRSRRRFLQVRLQTLIWLLTLPAIGLSIWSNYVRPYLVEYEIRQTIRRAGGECVTQHGPTWLESILGPKHCQLITHVDLTVVDFAGLAQANQAPSANGDTPPTPDELWEQIGEISALEVLRLSGTPVTDDIIAEWHGLSTLRELDLRGTDIQSAAYWPDFPLESLDVSETSLGNSSARPLTRYEQLESLNLDATLITAQGLRQLTALKDLKHLSAIDTAVSPRDRSELSELAGLTSLSVGLTRGGGFGDDLGAQIWPMSGSIGPHAPSSLLLEPPPEIVRQLRARLEQSRSIELHLNPVEALHLDAIGSPRLVTHLDLSHTYVRDEDLVHLERFPNLLHLTLDATAITDAGLQHVAKCQRLQKLSISETQIGNAGMLPISQLEELERLYLHRTNVTDSGLFDLRSLKRLHTISLSEGLIRGHGLVDLQELPALELVVFERPGYKNRRALSARPLGLSEAEQIFDFLLALKLRKYGGHVGTEFRAALYKDALDAIGQMKREPYVDKALRQSRQY